MNAKVKLLLVSLFFVAPAIVYGQKDSVWLKCPLDEANIVPPPKNVMKFDEPDLCVGLVRLPDTTVKAWHALVDRADLKAGETLLVLGAAGGVGIAAVELGKLLGARVIAAASSDDKLAFCRDHGADETIQYTREDLKDRAKQLTRGDGVDVVYDRSAARSPNPPCDRLPGKAATSSSASPPARSRSSPSTSSY